MNYEKWLVGFVGLALGLLLSGFFANFAVNGNNVGMMRMMGIRYNTGSMMNRDFDDNMHGAMESMMGGLLNKEGDEFDKAFLSEMIEHHQGAVGMATAALSDAKHQEIKDLADGIISAQRREINMMREWQTSWGY